MICGPTQSWGDEAVVQTNGEAVMASERAGPRNWGDKTVYTKNLKQPHTVIGRAVWWARTAAM